MSELHKFLFDGLPVRGMLVRLTDAWSEILARRAGNTATGPYPEPVRALLGEMAAAAVLMEANIKFNGALVLQVFGDGPIKLAVAEVQPDLSMRATATVFLSPRRWPPRPGLAPWAYLNSTMGTRWMVSSRTPNRPVATWVMTWSSYGRMRSMYPPSPVQVNVLNATHALALESWVTLLTDPKDMPPPYQGTSILISGLPSPRLFREMLVSISL